MTVNHRHSIFISALGLLIAWPGAAAAVPIGPLHCNASTGVTRASGQVVTITGVVTAHFSSDKLARLYVQDSTAGVCVYGSPMNCAALGDSVRVTGTVTSTH